MRARPLHTADWMILAKQSRYRLRAMASACQLSIRQIERDFQVTFHTTPHQWLDELRLAHAAELLLQGEKIKVAAYETGFKDPSHFCRRFKQRFGLTPMEYVRLSIENRGNENVARSL